jgi:thioredoxin 1
MDRRTFVLAATTIGGLASTSALALNVKEIEIPGFAKAAAAGKPILVHVTAAWCGTCKIQKPIVSRLEKEPAFKDLVVFNVDFDSQKEILRDLQVQSQSTMIIFKGEREIDRSVGETDPAAIEALLKKAL